MLGGSDDGRRPSGVMQANEICFPLSFKGGGDPEVKSPRRKGPKKRGLSGEQFAYLARSILVATLSPLSPSLGKIPRPALPGAFAGKIVDGPAIVSDADPSYKRFCERSGFRHVELPGGKSKRVRNMQAINSRHPD